MQLGKTRQKYQNNWYYLYTLTIQPYVHPFIQIQDLNENGIIGNEFLEIHESTLDSINTTSYVIYNKKKRTAISFGIL